MKFKQYLNESQSTMYVDLKNLPDWVKTILSKNGIRKEVKVTVSDEVKISGNWHEGNVRSVYLYDNGKVKDIGSQTGEAGPWNKRNELAIYKGFDAKLSKSKMVLITNTYPKGGELFVHPDTMNAMISSGESDDLSNEEWFTLFIVKSYKSSYRREEAERYNVKIDSYIPSLVKKGYLSANKGINTKGKNALIQRFGNRFFDQVDKEKELGLKKKY